MPRKITAAVLVGTLMAGPAAATTSIRVSDIRASMDSFIQGMPNCYASAVYQEGRSAADRHASGNGWLIGGLLLPIIGLVALAVAGSEPAPEALSMVAAEDVPCFATGYRDKSRSNKRGKGLIGAVVGFALAFAILSSGDE